MKAMNVLVSLFLGFAFGVLVGATLLRPEPRVRVVTDLTPYYTIGNVAYQRGEPSSSCPYTGIRYTAWLFGWVDAKNVANGGKPRTPPDWLKTTTEDGK